MAQNHRRIDRLTLAVAEVLRKRIEAQGMTHTAVSERSGIARSTVGKILSGSRAIDLEEYALLADALGMSLSDLMIAAEDRV